jgi:hypothetical protein
MKNFSACILSFLFSIILTKTFGQNYADVQGTWTGTASLVEKFSGQFQSSERHIDLTIKDNKVTGTVKYSGDIKIGTAVGHDECFGAGAGELISVNIRTWDSTYDINIEGPECKLVAGGGNSGDGVTGIGISNQRFQLTGNHLNTTDLSGTETTVRNVENMGTFTRTITWHLVSSLDVELIVTPVGYDTAGVQKNYDDWLPEPGKDETNKGSYMKIKLKLQSKSGKPLKYKAQSFELKLSNTSTEPGITINYPLNPQPNQLPDLRFIPLVVAESDDQDQYITVSCLNGTTGEAIVASYDGGGATTLTAEATLSGGIHIKGHLVSGEEEIQIPKRIPGTMIATSWRTTHGNLEESIDNETSPGNSNNGDGLTVYEEYRGVMLQGKFKRLNPRKKELGIIFKIPSEAIYLKEGVSLFSMASGIETLLFGENEIPDNRRINQNSRTSNGFKQFVLRIQKRTVSGKDEAYGEADPATDIPARVTDIFIDADKIQSDFLKEVNANPNLPYNEGDVLANTVAHEMGHGVNVDHHGEDLPYLKTRVVIGLTDTIIYAYKNLTQHVTNRPYIIEEPIGLPGNQESGNENCIMRYDNASNWVQLRPAWMGPSGVMYFEVPPLMPGKIFCRDNKGTGINAGGQYFGNAIKGNCLSQIKLKD